jgi:predicted phosphodiesterase
LLVVSDVHTNAYGARLASRLAAGDGSPVDAVVLAGDMTNFGRRLEAQLFVDSFDAAGAPVIMVGGNHEDAPAMKGFAKAGYRVLEFAAAQVDGVTVYGVSDPLAYDPAVESDVSALEAQSQALASRLAALSAPPTVLIVHDRRQAEAAVAWAVETDTPLTVVFGNDHIPAIARDGPVLLVDAGTGGASGYEQIGARRGDWYTFVLLDFARDGDGELLAVTTLAYSVDGRSRVEYLPIAD